MVFIIPAALLLIAYSFLIFAYKKWWKKLEDYIPVALSEKDIMPFLSVIVPARNEAQNIAGLMMALAAQTYRKEDFEIILVDDYSTDETVALAMAARLPNLIIIGTGADAAHSSKKKAIAAGVQKAKGELILCTDADCITPTTWLHTMAAFYVERNASFIAAPVAYHFQKTPLQLLQAIDFLTLQGITAASVSARFHTMCNGANLAYTKKNFLLVDGFAGIDKVASGDDMLLMHKIWKQAPERVFYLKSKDAIVKTKPMLTWKDFIQQRIRWASKTTHYEDKRVLWTLVLIYFVNLMFFVLIVAAFWNPFFLISAFVFMSIKTIIEFPFVSSVAHFYNQRALMKYFFFLQPLHIAYTVSIGLLSQIGTYKWKGRRTK